MAVKHQRSLAPPVKQAELADWCIAHPPRGMVLTPCAEPGNDETDPDRLKACYKLRWSNAPVRLGLQADDEVMVTFDPEMADRHPPTAPQEDSLFLPGYKGVRYLTWGDPLLEDWLLSVRGDELREDEWRQLGLYRVDSEGIEYHNARENGRKIVFFSDFLLGVSKMFGI